MLNRLKPLIDDIQEDNFDGGLFTSYHQQEKSLKVIPENLAAFYWSHVFQILVTSMPCDTLEAKNDMFTEYRAFYRGHPDQLSQIDKFEGEYKPSDAIRWYTKPGFLFSLVNKALRSGDMLALYTFRYFIKDLRDQLHEAVIPHSTTPFEIYRGSKLPRNEVNRLRVNSFATNNSFFSCSRNREVAEFYTGINSSTGKSPSRGRNERQQSVLFIIKVDLKESREPVVADAQAQSENSSEEEMLFTLGSTFIITKVKDEGNDCLKIIYMKTHFDRKENKRRYEKYIRRRLEETSATVLFGRALVTIEGDYMHSLDYFHHLLQTLPADHIEYTDVYYNLGRIYRFLEKYDKSLKCYQRAEKLFYRVRSKRMFQYCRALGGVGVVYLEMGNLTKAIILLETAINLQYEYLPYNHTEIPFHLNRLGYAYFKSNQFERARPILHTAIEFFKTRMPIEHEGQTDSLHTLGMVYRALGDEEKAYKHFEKALHKRCKLLVKDHPSLASTYYQLSLMHEDRGAYDHALKDAIESLRIRSIKLPPYHSRLKQSRELVERLRQRLKSLKQLDLMSKIMLQMIRENRIDNNSFVVCDILFHE